MIRATGWDPFESSDWPEVVEMLTGRGGEWPLWAVRHDLRWWASVERLGLGARPGRPALVKRYGWGDRRLRDYIAGGTWEDPRYVQPTSSEGPAKVQRTSSRRPATTTANVDNRAEMSSRRPADVQPTSSVGPADVPTRVGSQTQTQTQITDTDPHGSPAKPASRPPDGTTDPSGTLPLPVATPAIPAGPADGGREGNTREPSVARNASAPRGGRAAPGGASAIPDDVLAAYAELDPERAASIRAGGHVGIASALAKAASKPTTRGGGVGPERLAARLRYIARNPGDPTVRAWRERTGGEVSQVLRGTNGWTVPIDARVDDLAAKGRALTAAPPKPATPPPLVVDRSAERARFESSVLRLCRTACAAYSERTGRYPVPGALPPSQAALVARAGGWERVATDADGDAAEAASILLRAWDAAHGVTA